MIIEMRILQDEHCASTSKAGKFGLDIPITVCVIYKKNLKETNENRWGAWI